MSPERDRPTFRVAYRKPLNDFEYNEFILDKLRTPFSPGELKVLEQYSLGETQKEKIAENLEIRVSNYLKRIQNIKTKVGSARELGTGRDRLAAAIGYSHLAGWLNGEYYQTNNRQLNAVEVQTLAYLSQGYNHVGLERALGKSREEVDSIVGSLREATNVKSNYALAGWSGWRARGVLRQRMASKVQKK